MNKTSHECGATSVLLFLLLVMAGTNYILNSEIKRLEARIVALEQKLP